MELSFTNIKGELNRENGIEFEICLVGAHYMHGKVERKIKDIKESISKNMYEQRMTSIQWETLMQEVANSINNMPIGLGNKVDSLENLDIITPNRLLLGRNNERCVSAPVVISNNFRGIVQQNAKIFNTWFDAWLISYVPELMKRTKWHKSDDNTCVGDVVLFFKSDKEFERKYQYGIVKEVSVNKLGQVGKVIAEYQNHNEGFKHTTPRGIRDLVVVHLVDELSINKELSKCAKQCV